jgi:hypothetical protein
MGFYRRRKNCLDGEIWQAESLALGLVAGDSVLCITAGEDRPLHLLLDNPRRVMAIACYPQQSRALQHNIQAIRGLSYRCYLSLVGGSFAADRQGGRVRCRPPYLKYNSYEYIRQRIDRIEIATVGVAAHLCESCDDYDAFSLSDIASHLPDTALSDVMQMCKTRANTGARFCLRANSCGDNLTSALAFDFVRDKQRERLAALCQKNVSEQLIAGRIY